MTKVIALTKFLSVFQRLRSLFLVLTALGYGLLSGGPSLWALALRPAPRACQVTGCSCEHTGHAGACCCRVQDRLLKKFPDLARDPLYMKWVQPPEPSPVAPGEAVWKSSCEREGAAGTQALPPMPPHILVQVDLPFHLDVQRVRSAPAPRGSSFLPGPPSPIPD